MLQGVATRISNGLWIVAQRPAQRRFLEALQNPEESQKRVLRRLLASNQNCAYGRKHGFGSLRNVYEFQRAVPIVSYDDLEPWVERLTHGEQRVLTDEPVLMMEKSSGSAAAAKYIPYTSSLRCEFQNALAAWMCDLFEHYPKMRSGRAYWVLTPLARDRERTPGGLSIGFESDDQYFGALEQYLIRQVMAVPREIARLDETEVSLYVTLRFLLQARNLAFISAWNPSFLFMLLHRLREFGERLVYDLEHGAIDLPRDLTPEISQRLRQAAVKDLVQAARLRATLREGRIEPGKLWPDLRLISCWTSASAESQLREIHESFPGVVVQGKGLLATEGVVSVPLHDYGGCVPACTSHFLEFMDETSPLPKLTHELEAGREYSVIITTGGGFWRYRLGDRVRVTAVEDKVPLMEFVGKEDGVSDLCGEKLSPALVGKAFSQMRKRGLLVGRFSMLTPATTRRHYVLFTDDPAADPGRLDELLRDNPHYDYCRRVGQLGPIQLFEVSSYAEEDYIRRCQERGQRAGAVKVTPLDAKSGWEEVFSGELTPRAAEVVA
jgi:hypothetical protein